MMKPLIAIALITGACSAYPHQDGSTIVPLPETHANPGKTPVDPKSGVINPEGGAFNPENDSFDPEKEPFNPEKGPVDHERGPYPAPYVPLPGDKSEDIPVPQDGPKPESDLKTDATFWPFYRSYWGYPTYRSYSWGYPYYRYYRPRTYYTYHNYW